MTMTSLYDIAAQYRTDAARLADLDLPAEVITDTLYDTVAHLLRYEPETGIIRWKMSRGGIFAGSVAGAMNQGYIQISINSVLYRAHRLAWLLSTGIIPDRDIDHIDGDRANNRWGNLRLATRAENMQNQRRARSNSRIGLLGVSANKSRWMARIKYNGETLHIGTFDTPEQAHDAYIQEKRRLHPMGNL